MKKNSNRFLLLLVFAFGILSNSVMAVEPDASDGENAQFLLEANQQQIEVTGTVTDAQTGNPLPGVNIVVEGTTIGSTTDIDGNYSIEAPSDATLLFSFVGYQQVSEALNGRQEINVALEQVVTELEEVVAIGYGTREKGRLTGSVSSTTGESLEETPTVDLQRSMQGRLPGLKINDRGGEPGNADMEMLVRGKASLGNNSPLIVIDGVPRDEADFSHIAPQDIEDISILKDASAAIYGARAANGVILIRTKEGQKGEEQISIESNYGLSTFSRVPTQLTSYQFAVYRNELDAGYGRSPFFSQEDLDKFKSGDYPLTHPSPDWYDYAYRDWTPQTQHTISASGGNEKGNYFISGEYLHKAAQYHSGDNYFNRYQVRSNLNAQVAPFLKLGVDLSGRIRDRHYPRRAPWYEIPQIKPYAVGTFPNGLYGRGIAGINFRNATSDRDGYQEEFIKSLRSNFSFDLDMDFLTDGLKLLGNASFNFDDRNHTYYMNPSKVYSYNENDDTYTEHWAFGGPIRYLRKTAELDRDEYLNARLDYEASFEDHNLTAFVGYEQTEGYMEGLKGYRRNLFSDRKVVLGMSGTDQQSADGWAEEWGRVNYFGSIGYDYQRKYLIDFTFRRDGSYNFPKKGRFGNFPSISAGWNISKEPFMAFSNGWLDNLKIRSSWAKMGNDRIPSFQYLTMYALDDFHIFGDDGGERFEVFQQDNIPNPYITWETAKNFNVGFDAQLFGNLMMNFDYFYEKRREILITRNASVPDYSGLQLPEENLGKVDNSGVELVLGYNNNIGSLNYNLDGNFQFSENRIVYIDEPPDVPPYRQAEGNPMDARIVYNTAGIFHSQEEIENPPDNVVVIPGQEPGDIKYVDMNGDGEITGEDKYRKSASSTPKIQYGFNPGLEFKGFRLNLFFYGQAMVETPVRYGSPVTRLNVPTYYFTERWTSDNPDAKYPRAYPGPNESNTRLSDFWFYNASYISLKNATLSYDLPDKWLSRINFRNARIYVKASEPWVIWDGISARTGTKDFHPELGGLGGEAWNPAYYYPQLSTITFGLKLSI